MRVSQSRMRWSALAVGLVIAAGAAGWTHDRATSEWVYPGADGKLVYQTTPAGDRIMDFSYAGYRGGGVALPEVPVKITVQPVEGDNTAAIQAALDKVSALHPEQGFRGAVLLAPGDYPCSTTLSIRTSGVVLRGSGSGAKGSTIKMVGGRHVAIAVGRGRIGRAGGREAEAPRTSLADAYVPAGATSLRVADASGFAVGDTIEIRRPVTPAWVHFMQMDNLTRDGRSQTWIRTGTSTITTRRIAALAGNKITLDVPLSDSFDAKYLNPPGIAVVKVNPPALLAQIGIEHLCIQAPPMEVNYTQCPYTAVRLTGQDCWMRDVRIEETMNSVSLGGRRLTLEQVAVHRTVPNVGASKPAEFAPNAGQVLLDRCSSEGDNIWHVATGAGIVGPIVLLNCTFRGNGCIEGHQRWTTGMLLDNCQIPAGGIHFKNRGAMGSGHGWGVAWAVAWNCVAKSFVVQQPPGACNWMIGCTGTNVPTPRPFDSAPALPLGISDSPGRPVAPRSLYLAQLAERLGPQAVRNIGYKPADGGQKTESRAPSSLSADFSWTYAAPVLEARAVDGMEFIAVKDPSLVRSGDKWHLFCTVRGPQRTHAIVYSSFGDFGAANAAPRRILPCHSGYFCAPQVFFFTPQQKWYLICQAADPAWGEPAYRPAFSTTTTIGDPNSWAKLRPMFETQPAHVKAWLDFWVICDEAKAYLFFTSLDGKMWRSATALAEFPQGWSAPVVALTGDIFEASHTYRLQGLDQYLTLVEAQNGHGWRYYRAYLADRLDGAWRPLAADRNKAFASMRNVKPTGAKWTDVISHGELLRVGCDEKLEVDPAHLRFLFQGVLDKDRQGKGYGEIPWRLGLLE